MFWTPVRMFTEGAKEASGREMLSTTSATEHHKAGERITRHISRGHMCSASVDWIPDPIVVSQRNEASIWRAILWNNRSVPEGAHRQSGSKVPVRVCIMHAPSHCDCLTCVEGVVRFGKGNGRADDPTTVSVHQHAIPRHCSHLNG